MKVDKKTRQQTNRNKRKIRGYYQRAQDVKIHRSHDDVAPTLSFPPKNPSLRLSLERGQDLPRDVPSEISCGSTPKHDLSTPTPTQEACQKLDTDGIHPSRLAFFGPGAKETDSGMATAAVMAPPRPEQRHAHGQSLHPAQQKPTTSTSTVNGVHQQNQQQKHQAAEPDQKPRQANGPPPTSVGNGPMSSHIQVAKPYVFQQAIEGCLKDVGVAQAREDNIRLAGVQWIDNVRRDLKLPVRTFDTAVIYYHKFRLVHSDGEYSFVDAAAAALFAACKIEDTLKKSRDILCAAHNLKLPNRADHLAPDDSMFEHHSRTIIGLERLMLESSSFDFRNRHPQALLIKLAKRFSIPRSSAILQTAYKISLDLYRTFAPLKHCTATLAYACLELSGRLLKEVDNYEGLRNVVNGEGYDRWGITRAEVMETLLDLLELYTHYRNHTIIGPDLALDVFIEVRIPLNEELSEKDLPRFTEYIDPARMSGRAGAGSYAATVNGVPAAAHAPANGMATNTSSPTSPVAKSGQNGIRQRAGERGKEGTVRFMLNPDREREERAVVAEYGPLPGAQAVTGPAKGPHPQQR